MTIKTIFLDRDGVINKEINYLYRIEDFEFIDGVFSACKHFINLGYKIIIVTNQSGISRGYYTLNDFNKITLWMLDQFKSQEIDILDVFYCPHSPDDNCNCRKPKPGMFIEAKKKHSINMKESWMIGDSQRDITAASLTGITKTILLNSGDKTNEENAQPKYYLNSVKDTINVVKF